MVVKRFIVVAVLTCAMVASACRDEPERKPVPDRFPSWIPVHGVPLPGHGDSPPMADAPYRPLTPDELLAVAYAYHPHIRMAELHHMSIPEHKERFWNSPQQIALAEVQEASYARLDRWQALCDAVRRAVPPEFMVADRTYPRYFPAYVLVVDAPIPPGTKEEKFLVVHLSYLVPYYFYYERHSRRVPVESRPDLMAERSSEHLEWVRQLGGFIERDPLLYEATSEFEPVLEVIEREIEARFGYMRMPLDVAMREVPGIEINGYNVEDWDETPPRLIDALFTPHRW